MTLLDFNWIFSKVRKANPEKQTGTASIFFQDWEDLNVWGQIQKKTTCVRRNTRVRPNANPPHSCIPNRSHNNRRTSCRTPPSPPSPSRPPVTLCAAVGLFASSCELGVGILGRNARCVHYFVAYFTFPFIASYYFSGVGPIQGWVILENVIFKGPRIHMHQMIQAHRWRRARRKTRASASVFVLLY
jgi:hypothetical protein